MPFRSVGETVEFPMEKLGDELFPRLFPHFAGSRLAFVSPVEILRGFPVERIFPRIGLQ